MTDDTIEIAPVSDLIAQAATRIANYGIIRAHGVSVMEGVHGHAQQVLDEIFGPVLVAHEKRKESVLDPVRQKLLLSYIHDTAKLAREWGMAVKIHAPLDPGQLADLAAALEAFYDRPGVGSVG